MKQQWNMKIGGFKFMADEEQFDWDIIDAKSILYKYTKHMWQRAMQFKYDNERDYMRTEYDCNGSTCVRIKVKRKGSHFRIYYHESRDN